MSASTGGTSDGDLNDGDLRTLYYWLWLAASHYPESTAPIEYATIGQKISTLLAGDPWGITGAVTDKDAEPAGVDKQLAAVHEAATWAAEYREILLTLFVENATRTAVVESLVSRRGLSPAAAALCLALPMSMLLDP